MCLSISENSSGNFNDLSNSNNALLATPEPERLLRGRKYIIGKKLEQKVVGPDFLMADFTGLYRNHQVHERSYGGWPLEKLKQKYLGIQKYL